MHACIYARTSKQEKRHTTTKIERQVEFCLELARRRNLAVDPEHIFTDVEMTGDLPPSCWVDDNRPSRPALAALIGTIETHRISVVLVRRVEKLGTTSDVLGELVAFLEQRNVMVIASREVAVDPTDATVGFVINLLGSRLHLVDDELGDTRERLKARKLEEAVRLRAKLARLEAEIADM